MDKKGKKINDEVLLMFLFIISMTIAFLQNTGIVSFNYLQQYAIALLWVFLGVYKIVLNHGIKGNYAESIKFYLKMFLFPCIFYWAYTLFIYTIGQGNLAYFRTSIINLTMLTIIILCAFSCLYIFKDNLLKYVIYTIATCLIIITLNAVIHKGPFVMFITLFEILAYGESTDNPFEVGDITFATGLLLLLYSFKKKSKKEIGYLIFCWFIIIIGFKRIQILSLLVVFILGIGLKVWNQKLKKMWMLFSSAILIFVAYYFVYAVYSGLLSNFIWSHGINTMGRINMYSFMANYFQFSPNFLGHGYAYSLRVLNEHGFKYVLHSDILRFYIEFGFILFGLWQWYYLVFFRKRIEVKFSFKFSVIYYILTIYLFLLYFTDNTFSYFITQFVYMIVLVTLSVNHKFLENFLQGKMKKYNL